VYYNVSVDITA